MKPLLDECAPRRLKRSFDAPEILTVDEAGFKGLKNGALIRAAADAGFKVLVTVDKNIEHQQNKTALPLAILILTAFSNRLESLLPLVPKALEALDRIEAGEIIIIEF